MSRERAQRQPVRRVLHRGKIIPYSELPLFNTAATVAPPVVTEPDILTPPVVVEDDTQSFAVQSEPGAPAVSESVVEAQAEPGAPTTPVVVEKETEQSRGRGRPRRKGR